MTATKERIDYIRKWQNEKTDRVNLTVPKGKRALIQEVAESRGMSMNEYVLGLIEKDSGISLKRDVTTTD